MGHRLGEAAPPHPRTPWSRQCDHPQASPLPDREPGPTSILSLQEEPSSPSCSVPACSSCDASGSTVRELCQPSCSARKEGSEHAVPAFCRPRPCFQEGQERLYHLLPPSPGQASGLQWGRARARCGLGIQHGEQPGLTVATGQRASAQLRLQHGDVTLGPCFPPPASNWLVSAETTGC